MCYKPPLVRDKPLGASASVKRVYLNMFNQENSSKNVVCSIVAIHFGFNEF